MDSTQLQGSTTTGEHLWRGVHSESGLGLVNVIDGHALQQQETESSVDGRAEGREH